MIESFACKETEAIWSAEASRKLPADIQRVALRKLFMLQHAKKLDDLRIPPSNNLEVLKGSLKGFYSIRVNKQWRIVFQWSEGNARSVRIMDYH